MFYLQKYDYFNSSAVLILELSARKFQFIPSAKQGVYTATNACEKVPIVHLINRKYAEKGLKETLIYLSKVLISGTSADLNWFFLRICKNVRNTNPISEWNLQIPRFLCNVFRNFAPLFASLLTSRKIIEKPLIKSSLFYSFTKSTICSNVSLKSSKI